MIYPFSSTQLQSLDSGTVLRIKVGSKGLVKTLRLYNFTPAFWQLTNDYDIVIDTLPPWREKIVRVSDSQNYYLTSDPAAPYFSSSSVSNTQYQFGYEQTNKKWMPEEIPLLSLVQVTGSLPAGTAQLGTVGLTGSLAPLTAGPWVDIVTMTAAEMPAASTNTYPSYTNILHANARDRLFRLANTLNEAWTVSFWVVSSVGPDGTTSYGAMSAQTIGTGQNNLYFGSRALPNLGEAGTAIQMNIGSGSTVATTGQWTLSVKEIF